MNARTARQIDRAQPDLNPGEKYLRTLEHLGSDSLISDVSQYTLNNLRKELCPAGSGHGGTGRGHSPAQRPEVYCGLPGTACCAQYMASKLLFLAPHVVPILHADASAVENLLDITDRDCLFLYSFPGIQRSPGLCWKLPGRVVRR